MGVFDPLGKRENKCLSCFPDCDIRRVLITHIGLVATVLEAPAIMDDQKLITKGLSAYMLASQNNSLPVKMSLTMIWAQMLFALVIYGKPYRPRRQVSHNYRPQSPVHASDAFFPPYHTRGSYKTLVGLGAHHMLAVLCRSEASLGLEFGLDDIEWACYDARGKPSHSAG